VLSILLRVVVFIPDVQMPGKDVVKLNLS